MQEADKISCRGYAKRQSNAWMTEVGKGGIMVRYGEFKRFGYNGQVTGLVIQIKGSLSQMPCVD